MRCFIYYIIKVITSKIEVKYYQGDNLFDKFLLEDLKEFKLGADNIYDLQFRYANIRKIIKNRTKEKMNLLKLFLDYKIINTDDYNELFNRIQSDYKISYLYIMGFIPSLEQCNNYSILIQKNNRAMNNNVPPLSD